VIHICSIDSNARLLSPMNSPLMLYTNAQKLVGALLSKLLEPLMIVVLGGIIGTIVTAMYMPMYAILQKIG